MVDTSGSLLRNTVAVLELFGIFGVDESSQVSAVIEDKIELLVVLESGQGLLEAPIVFLLSLSLPGEAV